MKRLQAISVLPEAMLLMHGNGTVIGANSAARELFGVNIDAGVPLSSLVNDSPEKVIRSLDLWSSSHQFLPSSLQVNCGDEAVVIRCDGAALEAASRQSPCLLLLRCVRRGDSATTKFFIKLNEQIDNLWKQIAEQKA